MLSKLMQNYYYSELNSKCSTLKFNHFIGIVHVIDMKYLFIIAVVLLSSSSHPSCTHQHIIVFILES